mmetsp:Transcript_36925/g.78308  ORF Transcript_36925/g.78308 Transcript_36925/m.78308 type:complete len:129 (-) Transcript_36925:632-1018(-)|eukprot:CAMPEP_0206482084 /NCGR_PEP_ID=MMETSP0324_2-20121206/38632_1 /ASSEMBLY_ACC=CAM_ASM_000836 /TAXON_ID=2866 /ORGANISM="Crypthecodinium cohnii, Strain Seligo" /LENGTH=128 /DNA_ID=CAMNT_0053959901 /DNA_START=266 /DNA_END=652 /DNA_ORIENTATION=+
MLTSLTAPCLSPHPSQRAAPFSPSAAATAAEPRKAVNLDGQKLQSGGPPREEPSLAWIPEVRVKFDCTTLGGVSRSPGAVLRHILASCFATLNEPVVLGGGVLQDHLFACHDAPNIYPLGSSNPRGDE